MKSNFADSHQLRKYLLREISDATELEGIEMRMLSDGLFLAEIERVEAELIEEYLNQMLNSEEKKNFENHFLAAPERKEKFRFMLALEESAAEHAAEKAGAGAAERRDQPRPSFFQGFFASRVLRLVAGSVLLMAAGAGLCWYFVADSKVRNGLAELRTAYLKQRPTEARLSALDYAPLITTRGGGSDEVDEIAREQAGQLLRSAVQERPGADSYRALGLYYASLRKFDIALDQFGKGERFKSSDAVFYADFGAVLLETAKTAPNESPEKRSRHLDDSLSKLNHALELDSGFLPALFNRALCLEEMSSFVAAREAWQKYLEKDSTSKWAKEARDHIKTLDEKKSTAKKPEQVLDDFLQAYGRGDEAGAWKIAGESKEMITGTMLSEQLTRRYLDEMQRAPNDAESTLSALRFLGGLEKTYARDNFFSELADYYRQTGAAERENLIRAQALTTEGYALCAKSKYLEALPKFRESQKLFAAARDHPEAAKTSYWISYCLADDDGDESLKTSQALAEQSRGRSYKWLLGQALTQSGSTYSRQSKFSPAIRSSEEALDIARDTSDTYNYQKASGQLSNIYTELNDTARAWEHSQNSLRETGAYFNSPRQAWRNYMFAAQTSQQFGLAGSAIAYAQESVRLSRDVLEDPAMLHNSFVFLSAVYRKGAGDYNDALNAAEESNRVALTFDAGKTQNRLLADSLLQKAEAQRSLADCVKALETYEQAVSINREQKAEETIKNYHARRGKLFCYEELGRDENVEEDLPPVLKLAEGLRGKIEKEDSKTSFFAGEQRIYEFAAAHALKKNDTAQAFDYIENGKARSLLDGLRPAGASSESGSGNVLTLPEIRRQLPAGAQLVQYAVLPDKLLIWVVTAAEVKYAERDISGAELTTRVRDFMRLASSAASDDPRLKNAAAGLYTLLLEPVQPFLDKEKAVGIVPDKVLCYLPFEALRSPAGKYAVEDYQISYAPSATLFVLLSQTALKRSSAGGAESFLGVGNPYFDRTANPGLSDLPAAENEIRSSAAFYRVKREFNRDKADKKNILLALPRADVFHFAGHFAANEISPQFSKFLLAGKLPASENDLTAWEIGALKLSKTRLVVLSACKTAIENYYQGEGAIGIARTFFAAGAPVVVASRWEVDTSASAKLMVAFHRNRKERGLSAPAALRAAQIELLKDERFNSPYFWAAFAAIGGIEKF